MNTLARFHSSYSLLRTIRQKLESIEIRSSRIARLLCQLIPASCPFEREIKIGDRTLFYLPPLCKLNPLYNQLVELRFKSLVYLAEKCD
jgi:hypothetical protein